jgi:hypothetical protein
MAVAVTESAGPDADPHEADPDLDDQPGEPETDGAWSGPWADDARQVYEAIQGLVGRLIADPQVQGLIRRTGPIALDRVADLAAGLAATLREPGSPDQQDQPEEPARPGRPPGPPATVRIDVTE